ncbi:MAG: prepilin-type N-terminal cleavage/methylation domain-containing protein [Phycisphaerae bacterium]|nr:prepilin-type N-terminal cleavage/methylation domain-containing protein [Phycisphaerae bacterium]
MSKLRRAFTLIELLVVIAIVALLISILLPALGQARQTAKSIVCASGQNQMGKAMSMYVMNNRSYYPGDHFQGFQARYSLITWIPRIRLYLTEQSEEAFWCPSTLSDYRWVKKYSAFSDAINADLEAYKYEKNEVPFSDWNQGLKFFSYGYNGWGIQDFTDPHLGLGGHVRDYRKDLPDYSGVPWTADERRDMEITEARVRMPSDMICTADSKTDGNWDCWITPQRNYDKIWPSNRHFGGAQVLFCDGHVSIFKQSELLDLNDDRVRSRWNNDGKPHPEFGGN